MKYQSLKKSFSICAAALMLISAGGNTLQAGAKSYHHKRISRRITRRHISRYQYKKNYQLYKRLIRYIQSAQGRLKKLRGPLKKYKHGRLARNVRKHRCAILKGIKYNQKITKRLNNKYRFTQAKKTLKKPKKTVVKIKKSVQKKIAKKKRHNKDTSLQDSDSSVIPNSDSKSTSTSSKKAESSNYDPDQGAFNTFLSTARQQMRPQINSESSNESPETNSADAWNYINALSGVYNSENNYCESHSHEADLNLVDRQTLDSTEQDYAFALGHASVADTYGSDDFADKYADNSAAAADQLNSWYEEHSINSSTASADAYNWRNRNSSTRPSPLNVPTNFGIHDDTEPAANGDEAAANSAAAEAGADYDQAADAAEDDTFY